MVVMGTRDEQKERTHEAIVAAAAARLAREGIAAASVARVMRDTGLTVGGFYAHFPSKDHLAAEGLRRAFEDNMGQLFEGLDDASPEERYDRVVRRYLSRQHRDAEERACPVPACVSEVDPAAEPVRDALVEGLDAVARRLAALFADRPDFAARERAQATLCTFVGAMALARATRGTPRSDQFLLAARKLLRRIPIDGERAP
jgi:TetR/AcrR family transcriptional repressor of nem operon